MIEIAQSIISWLISLLLLLPFLNSVTCYLCPKWQEQGRIDEFPWQIEPHAEEEVVASKTVQQKPPSVKWCYFYKTSFKYNKQMRICFCTLFWDLYKWNPVHSSWAIDTDFKSSTYHHVSVPVNKYDLLSSQVPGACLCPKISIPSSFAMLQTLRKSSNSSLYYH